ncbi:polymorphic toxin-type HINT domain-containing protein [Runella sp. SP2]|uniref:polymorphic toxin-type HINT domain-containing protein n=1 Tax=Runella sp. SP2 TaxID=2268026 RepID=UPI000F094C73|nr:polymorphic toxin-type HINT domain-containing protein [Runella sp. SP2]AYQ32155.1 hypothetical protein DTQ70_08190 [Runella sp. SP2]
MAFDYVVAPLTTAIAKHGAVLVRKAFEDKLKVPKPVCDVIFTGNLCFVAVTPIRMADGSYRPIESIKAGDLVWSRDEFTKQETAQHVQKPFSNTAHRLVKVIAGIDTILTTPEHPFYVENKGMTQAQFLHKGDLFSTASPTEASLALLPHLARSGIAVDSIHLLDSTVAVYNFEVSNFHTYFVGSQSIWVHNANCGPKPKLLHEFEVDSFTDLQFNLGSKFDNLTPHHIPSDKFMTILKGKFPTDLAHYSHGNGLCIFLEETLKTSGTRHGRTYTKGHTVANDPKGYYKMTPLQALEFDLEDVRQILKDDKLYDASVEAQLQKIKSMNLKLYPNIFK